MNPRPKIYVIGIGPGSIEEISLRAKKTIELCDAIVGYTVYVRQIADLITDKLVFDNGMGGEKDRCQRTIDLALEGKNVAIVCSGDSGLYGMAGLIYELLEQREILDQVEVEVIPGISAAFSSSALLGAPIVEDFCTVSLSDYMTPYEKILKRIELASEADFTIALYNPRSLKRPDYLRKVLDLILKERKEDTPVGIVKNAGREGQEIVRTTLGKVPIEWVDMFSTVVIGNSKTRWIGDFMVTSRGYQL